ncbi:MAG: ATP-dependent Clp protease ATP-binding subunit ClpA, partial [Candidatus Moduliflexus flocculans]|nr:ATP-dependent Clp protease ATP-binding subunit ClpA [Candidatus Moduliflexus flocculans]
MKVSQEVQAIFNAAYNEAEAPETTSTSTPEHILYAALSFEQVRDHPGGLRSGRGAASRQGMESYFEQKIPAVKNQEPIQTAGFQSVIERAVLQSQVRGQGRRSQVADVLVSLFDEERNYSAYYLRKAGVKRLQLLEVISHGLDEDPERRPRRRTDAEDEEEAERRRRRAAPDEDEEAASGRRAAGDRPLRRAGAFHHRPDQGRPRGPARARRSAASREIERTVQVLCRRLKNNPIHVGDAGVGKTAITEGLAQRIVDGEVPPPLAGLHASTPSTWAPSSPAPSSAATSRSGVKRVVDELLKKRRAPSSSSTRSTPSSGPAPCPGGSMDASNLLKPALTSGKLRCIGSTTYEEYNKFFEKDRALSRRFQKIEVLSIPFVVVCLTLAIRS